MRGQPLFVTIRASGRRNMLTALWKAGFLFLFLYCVIWFLGGLLGMKLLGYELTVHVWKCLAGSVGLKFCDVLFQYLVMFTIYLCTKQITAGFLAILEFPLHFAVWFCVVLSLRPVQHSQAGHGGPVPGDHISDCI